MIIWLSSYPRSGNTFLRTLLKSCLEQDTYSIYNDNDIGGDPGLSEITGHRVLECAFGSPCFNLEPLRSSNEIFFLKTHEVDRSLVEPGDKVIYIIRNGYAATFSFQKYLKEYDYQNITFLELILGIDFPGGSWSDHVSGWMEEEYSDTLLLRFEEVTEQPKIAIDQIAKFSGLNVIEYRIPEFDELQNLNPRFFRKGKREDFKGNISKEENLYFWVMNVHEMQAYNYLECPHSLRVEQSDELISVLSEGMRQYVSYIRGFKFQLGVRDNAFVQLDKNKLELEKRAKSISQKDNELEKKESKIKALEGNNWYRFGQMSRKRKMWKIGKIVSKKIKIYWVLKLIFNIYKTGKRKIK